MKCSIIVAAFLLLPFSAAGQGINDAEIAAIVVTANQVDIDAGKLALSRAANDKVKAFAQLMITDPYHPLMKAVLRVKGKGLNRALSGHTSARQLSF